VLAVASFLAVRGLGSRDEARIRARLDALARAVAVTPDDASANPLVRYGRLNEAFAPIFDPEVRVCIPVLPGDPSGRRALVTLATEAPARFASLKVEFDHVHIKLDPPGTSALVAATAHLRGEPRGEPARADDRAVDLRFAKVDGEWQITTVTVWPSGGARPE
jgi:hypothetical protein